MSDSDNPLAALGPHPLPGPDKGILDLEEEDTVQAGPDDYTDLLHAEFEQICNVYATVEAMGPEETLGTLIPYRDHITDAHQTRDDFVGWLQTQDRREGEFPKPRGAHLISAFDRTFVEAATVHGIKPAESVTEFEAWLEQTIEEAVEMHNLSQNGLRERAPDSLDAAFAAY
jgi:hypothetical protein